jgi:uncharacterized protein (DUF169 family)
MAKPIEFGLVLEGEDAKTFIENIEYPVVTEKMIQTLKKSREIYEKNRF